jgi:basic amino acid/polyamine antiporter, APA family
MAELKRSLGTVQFFSIGFGTIVGVGWIVYLGLWFQQAGPVGTMVAFLLGGLLMAVIGLCYAELATMYPVAGAEAAYGFAAFGRRVGFAIGWALVLMLIAVIPYVSVSLAWILDVLVPGIAGPVLYEWRGQPIHATALAIAAGWTLWLGFLNYRGIRGASRFQDWFTYGKIAISLLFFGAGIFGGRVGNLEPMFGAGGAGLGSWAGVLAVLATTPWFLAGFNQIPQLLEERAGGTPVRSVGIVVVLSILAGAVYYALAALSAGMAGPWQAVVSENLPAAAAFRLAFDSELLARAVLVTGLFGIGTVGNACSIAVTRLLFSLSRSRYITPAFQRLHASRGSPVTAIAFVTVFSLAGTFLGRAGIAPIVNVGSSVATLAYLVAALSLIRLRYTAPERERPYRVPGGVVTAGLAAAGGVFLLFSSLRQQWVDARGTVPVEWVVLAIWSAIGVALYWSARPARASLGPDAHRDLVLGAGAGS